ncbi:MAG: hypothetical protein F6K55_34990 [Moorea sp. SIO4A3]|nr:hypothetical protein [Moorena sp. SIO4A3]
MKYPNLLDLWSRYANAEVGASNSQVNSGTVLFVFRQSRRYANRVSRFIRRCLNQRRAPASIGLTQRPQADIRLPQTYIFTTDLPWNYSTVANQLGQVSSLAMLVLCIPAGLTN